MMIFTVIERLQKFFSNVPIAASYDMPMGAGTFHPYFINSIARDTEFSIQYLQKCRRPADGINGSSAHHIQSFYQYQVAFFPRQDRMLDIAIESLESIGLKKSINHYEIIEDDWSSPTLGAHGIGYEIRCNGLEILQFTYFQKFGGIACNLIAELAYGIERIAYLLSYNLYHPINSILDLNWNSKNDNYIEYIQRSESEYSKYNLQHHIYIEDDLIKSITQTKQLIQNDLLYPAYDSFLSSNHIFNILDNKFSNSQRQNYILKIYESFQMIYSIWRKKK